MESYNFFLLLTGTVEFNISGSICYINLLISFNIHVFSLNYHRYLRLIHYTLGLINLNKSWYLV